MVAAKKRGAPLEHVLLYGPAGLGKTTLAHLVAKETNSNLKATSGPAIEKVGDLASILTNLEEGDVLFIDEVHRLPQVVEEHLYHQVLVWPFLPLLLFMTIAPFAGWSYETIGSQGVETAP